MPMSVIEFQDATGEILVARVPQEGTGEFVTGSQLIVQDGQVAVFFRDGRPTDGFKAGRYTLETKNLPAYGGRSPFRAYVYFVQLKTFTNLGWGTPQPILYRDKKFEAIHLRAFGAFSIRVGNPSTLLKTLVGSQGIETTYAIEEWLRKFIAARFATLLPSVLDTILDLAEKYGEIAAALKQTVHDELAQYGIELVDLLVESISVPDEVQKMINRAAGTRAFADSEVGKAKDLAMADALRDSANQPTGGGMAEAMGMGAGFAMAQQMGASPGAPPPAPPAAVQWYTSHGGQQAGPFNASGLMSLAQSGQLRTDTYVWRHGMAGWVPAGQVAELAAVLGPPPPPQ
jgi:membrane protease subunit (stomatin/prohibitin family)